MLLAAQLAMLLADLLSCPAANCQLLMRHCRLRRGPPGRLRRRQPLHAGRTGRAQTPAGAAPPPWREANIGQGRAPV